MVAFGREIENRRKAVWSGFYVDYNGLKAQIKEIGGLFESVDLSSSVGLEEVRNRAEEFKRRLDYDISKAVVFYEEQMEDAVRGLAFIRKKWPYLTPATLPQLYEQCKEVAGNIRDCLHFVELNAEAVRKILKKAEKLLSNKVVSRDSFLRSRMRPDYSGESRLGDLRISRGTDALIEELRLRLDHMRHIETEWLEKKIIDETFVKRVHHRRNTEELLTDLVNVAHQTLQTTKWYYGLLGKAQIDYESEPVGTASLGGILLNNYNTFLYMANYYAVIPTANMYAAALGLSATASGVLLAMTPFSALISSIIYSMWSNRNFKQPLVFCTVLLILGNLLYALALDFHSIPMLFIGRLLVGLGGNRAVNRRYLADFVPVEARTFHSAIFVAVGSLGMSIGPGLQPLFDLMNFQIPRVHWTVNSLTAPGWIMLLLWILFGLQTIFFFTEPERRYAPAQNWGLLEPLIAECSSQDESSTSGSLRAVGRGLFLEQKTYPIDVDGTVVCLWVYFVLKLVQEAFQTAAPLVAFYYFQWTDASVGYLLAAIGLIVLPANIFVGWVSSVVDDRTSQAIALTALAFGGILSLDIAGIPYTQIQYVIAALTIFVAAQVLEGVNMSLLSKVMPKVMSKGLWNSGFLSTEAGTFGRVVGDVLITIAGTLGGIPDLQNLVMAPCILLIFVSMGFVIWKTHKLLPVSERLDPRNEAEEMLESELWAKIPELRPLGCTVQRCRTASIGTLFVKAKQWGSSQPRYSRRSLAPSPLCSNAMGGSFIGGHQDSTGTFGGTIAPFSSPSLLDADDIMSHRGHAVQTQRSDI